jgi:hypothetical protein
MTPGRNHKLPDATEKPSLILLRFQYEANLDSQYNLSVSRII